MTTRCTLCGLAGSFDSIGSDSLVRGRSPLTMRKAMMHFDCLHNAVDDIKGQPSHDPRFQDRYDYWLNFDDKEMM